MYEEERLYSSGIITEMYFRIDCCFINIFFITTSVVEAFRFPWWS